MTYCTEAAFGPHQVGGSAFYVPTITELLAATALLAVAAMQADPSDLDWVGSPEDVQADAQKLLAAKAARQNGSGDAL